MSAVTANTDPLRPDERQLLRACESIITDGLDGFVRVGEALRVVRDSRLYREDHGTFADYVERRWQMSDRRARQLMAAVEIVQDIESGTRVPLLPMPSNEGQVRHLADVPPEERAAIWNEAVATSPKSGDGAPQVTREHVKRVVQERHPAMSAPPAPPADLRPPPAFERTLQDSLTPLPKPESTVSDAVSAVLTAMRAGDPANAVRYAATAAMRVLKRRRMGTAPETLADCLQKLLAAIAEGAR